MAYRLEIVGNMIGQYWISLDAKLGMIGDDVDISGYKFDAYEYGFGDICTRLSDLLYTEPRWILDYHIRGIPSDIGSAHPGHSVGYWIGTSGRSVEYWITTSGHSVGYWITTSGAFRRMLEDISRAI